MKTKFNLLFSSCFLLSSNYLSAEVTGGNITENGNTVEIQCDNVCEYSHAIPKFLNSNPNFVFNSIESLIILKYEEEILDSLTVAQYLEKVQNTASLKSRKKTRNLMAPNRMMAPPDGSLDCRYDPEFSCEEWYNNPISGQENEFLANILKKSSFEITITAEYIADSNQLASSILGAMSYAIPGTIILKIVKNIGEAAYIVIATSVATNFVHNYVISSPNYTDLKPGDVLVIKGGVVTVRRKSENDGTSNTGGSGGGGEPGTGEPGTGGGGGGGGGGMWMIEKCVIVNTGLSQRREINSFDKYQSLRAPLVRVSAVAVGNGTRVCSYRLF